MTISPALRVFAWLSFIAEVIIIGTGGAVRLTGSGLGCDQWPLCTPGSLVPTQELGIHGLIEFGNRTMTGAVGILALLVLLFARSAASSSRQARTRCSTCSIRAPSAPWSCRSRCCSPCSSARPTP
jgi:cytochrome c oxidase assembly protein subunit 15